jgi:small subunit ribosomal protein S6
MFLVDSALATADWEGTLAFVENILKRADAEVVAIRKWGERKLAYDIEHKTRGTYILAYFKADGRRITGIEKDVVLSEKIMRVLILGTEKRSPDLIEADIKGEPRIEPEGYREREESEPRRERRDTGRDYDPMAAFDSEPGGGRRDYGDR